MVEEGCGNLPRGAVYTINTIIRRTILIDRCTQMARGRCSAGYNIHERLGGQYLLTAKHVIRGCGGSRGGTGYIIYE